MHYLLVHFDIPYVDAESWRLNLGGLVSVPISLSLDEITRRPTTTIAVTMECAGNGRALLTPRAISQPWLLEAIGTAEWTGPPLRGLLEEAGIGAGALEVLFAGLDQGVQGDEVQFYQRSLSLADALRDEVLLAYSMNGETLQPQHGYPLAPDRPGLVRHDQREVAGPHRGHRLRLSGLPAGPHLSGHPDRRRSRRASSRCGRSWCRREYRIS